MKYLTIDFGSTYTKVTAIDGSQAQIVGTASSFTTIETDVMEGFHNALAKLEAKIGEFNYDTLLCCSSAAGGLKMVALGLVPELTAKAAKMAAASAGAKVVKTYAYEISKFEQEEIARIKPDLVLLCGGTDGGNKEVIIANAKRLAEIPESFAIVVAGNKSASYDLEKVFTEAKKDFVITENVMPEFNKLNIAPAKQCIKDLFISRIIDAKGLSCAQKLTPYKIIPTPLAVLNGCELLSKGTIKSKGIGDLLAVDIGGATTDIYSMSKGHPAIDNVMYKGLPEPYSKRTVEGDLGMRYSLSSLLEAVHLDFLSMQTGIDSTKFEKWVAGCTANPDKLAKTGSEEQRIEEELARTAVDVAVERHAGLFAKAFTPMGEIFTLVGKDLTDIPYVIGIGGVIVNSSSPAYILDGCRYNPTKYEHPKPKNPTYLLYEKYIFASMGLLSAVDPELALNLLKKEIHITKLESNTYENQKRKIVQ